MKKKKNKKIKIKYNRLILFIFILMFFLCIIIYILNMRVTNIYVLNNENNVFFKDQQIIEMAGLSDYPKIISLKRGKIKKVLEENVFIKSADVKLKNFSKIYIDLTINYPLFYYKTDEKTVLYDGTKIDDFYNYPEVINYIPNLKYEEFLKKIRLVDRDILTKISQIKYDPSDYDDERFLLYMDDDNLVYITLYKFTNINKYNEIVKNFGNKRGIIYLDSGNYFEIKEN